MASIKKRPDGKWRARYRDDSGKEHAKHFARKVDAQRWLDTTTADLVSGTYVDPRAGAITLDDFYRQWKPRQVWAPGTVKAMDLAVKTASFKDVPLSKLRLSHLEHWVKAMDLDGLAPNTIRTRVTNVRTVLKGATLDRVLAVDPSKGLTLPRLRRREASMSIPNPEQVVAVIAKAERQWRPLFQLAAYGGLRLGEAAAIQVGDVEFLAYKITIARQVQRVNGGRVDIRPPKFGSERVVYLPEELINSLSRHVTDFCPGSEPTRWLFSAGEQPPHQNTVGYQWRRASRLAGVEGVTLHDLRHFYASGLIAAGCDVVTVQRALGHSKATTTLNTYAHLWPNAEDRTRAAAADLMRQGNSLADCSRTESIKYASD